jgi:hypothetical protein
LYDGTANNEFKNNLIYEVTYDVYITGTTMTYNKNASDRSDRPGLDRSLQYLRSDPFLNKNITYAQFPMLPDFLLRYATQDGNTWKTKQLRVYFTHTILICSETPVEQMEHGIEGP